MASKMNRYVTLILLILMFGLTGFGLVMISSTATPLPDSLGQLKRQMIWLAGGFFLFGIVGWVDYKVWRRWIWILFAASLFLVVLVFIPGIGSRVKGASRWINLLGFKIQPSEFLRLVVVMLLAHVLAQHQSRIKDFKWGFGVPLGIVVVPMILLRMEPDLGTVLLIAATTLAMMFLAGVRVWPLVGVGTLGAIGFGAMLWMMPERRARVLAFLDPEAHKEGKFFQIWQGMLAFGSGGRDGLGLGNSRQKMFYVPESTTDSIFPIIGEELGIYFTIAIVIAYMLILICGLWISLHARDTFGMFLGFGLVFGLVLQAVINIGTVTGSIPPKGMPLPFISYGGSNLMISYATIGFLISIHRQSLRVQKLSGGIPIDESTPRI